jgi:hypothetical protein
MNTSTNAAATAVKAIFAGLTENGSVSVPGLEVGDVLLRLEPFGFLTGFEGVVSVADQLQQTTTLDWSPVTFTAYFLRGV